MSEADESGAFDALEVLEEAQGQVGNAAAEAREAPATVATESTEPSPDPGGAPGTSKPSGEWADAQDDDSNEEKKTMPAEFNGDGDAGVGEKKESYRGGVQGTSPTSSQAGNPEGLGKEPLVAQGEGSPELGAQENGVDGSAAALEAGPVGSMAQDNRTEVQEEEEGEEAGSSLDSSLQCTPRTEWGAEADAMPTGLGLPGLKLPSEPEESPEPQFRGPLSARGSKGLITRMSGGPGTSRAGNKDVGGVRNSCTRVYRPDTAYAVPPLIVQSTNSSGVPEGQLLYQIGKVAPLSRTYTSYCCKDPPQRASVEDYRLSASQRSPSCYSPQFLNQMSVMGNRPATAPSMLHHVEPYEEDLDASWRSAPAGPWRPTTPSSPTRAVPPSSPSRRATMGLTPTGFAPARSWAARAGGGYSVGPKPASATPSQRAHPVSPLSKHIRNTTQSTFVTGGYFVPGGDPSRLPSSTVVKHAAGLITVSKIQSSITKEGHPRQAARHGHSPNPPEMVARSTQSMSSDPPLNMHFKRRVKWGVHS